MAVWDNADKADKGDKGVRSLFTAFFKTLRQTAEQLTALQRWYRVLSRALVKYLNGRDLHPPPGLPAPA